MESKRDRLRKEYKRKVVSLISDIKYLRSLGLSDGEIVDNLRSTYYGDCSIRSEHLREAFKRCKIDYEEEVE